VTTRHLFYTACIGYQYSNEAFQDRCPLWNRSGVSAGALRTSGGRPRSSTVVLWIASTGCVQLHKAEFCFQCRPAVCNSLSPVLSCATAVGHRHFQIRRSYKRISSTNDKHHPTPLWRFCDFGAVSTHNLGYPIPALEHVQLIHQKN